MTEKAVKKYGLPDIIHVHYPALQPYKTFEYYQKQGVKIVATEHWTKVQDHTLSGANVRRLKDFAAKCDALLCVGSYLKTAIREITGTDREIMIVPNVANKLFRPAEKKHDGFRFFAAGRFVPVKQFDRIVSAFCKVFRDIPGVTLTIAGSGKEAENIKSRVTPEMADRVRFTGTVNRERMAQLTADADGVVSGITAEAGQVVAAGQTVLTFVESGEMEVEINVPEKGFTHSRVNGKTVRGDALAEAGLAVRFLSRTPPGGDYDSAVFVLDGAAR